MNDVGNREVQMGEPGGNRATPVMSQFLEIKAEHPDSLLFYRMGDFYELFFGDAEIAARDLGITLTKRGKHLDKDIPMCGVPVHAADSYLQRLIRLGHRVAVCEQMEDPADARKRGSKSVVRRQVIRIVTPGTITEDSLLDSHRPNYLAAIARQKSTGDLALAWADISSGELAVLTTSSDRLAADIVRLDPSEIILAEGLLADQAFMTSVERATVPLTPLPSMRFESTGAERRVMDYFSVSALEGFGSFTRCEISALGGLLDYIMLTQNGRVPHLRQPRRELASSVLLIDPATRANLELTKRLGGEKHGSLLSVIDRCVTAAGSRHLIDRLSNPLLDVNLISSRLDDISHFLHDPQLREDIREMLAGLPDLDRALSRIVVGRAGPRDLWAIREALRNAETLSIRLAAGAGLGGQPNGLDQIRATLASSDQILRIELDMALAEELPLLTRDGGFVRSGFMTELDECRSLRDDTKQVIAGLQTEYSALTDIKTLKVRHNNVLGYFIEVPAQAAAILQAPSHAGTFIHRQTVANAMRFVTTELASLEQKIAAAASRCISIEQEIFAGLSSKVVAKRDQLSEMARAAAELDVASALAELAERRRYVRPKIDESRAFVIKAGRHPVVESVLEDSALGSFIANDCDLSAEGKHIWLLTGPNMAGKSTYLRQNALIVILAQMGSYVPAAEAHIGLVDRLFSRVGAADDLARGRSTFMVEMVETAAILNQATDRSFVILDEIGRGTATFDGLSIAWATIENLHDVNRCRALFATHYHELTKLPAKLAHLANATVKVREWNEEIIFLHEVVPGAADRSYGIHVARLAGLPAAVIGRAQKVLEKLERGESKFGSAGFLEGLPLFSIVSDKPQCKKSEIERKLAAITPDELSPREALEMLYHLKSLLADKR